MERMLGSSGWHSWEWDRKSPARASSSAHVRCFDALEAVCCCAPRVGVPSMPGHREGKTTTVRELRRLLRLTYRPEAGIKKIYGCVRLDDCSDRSAGAGGGLQEGGELVRQNFSWGPQARVESCAAGPGVGAEHIWQHDRQRLPHTGTQSAAPTCNANSWSLCAPSSSYQLPAWDACRIVPLI